VCQHAVGTSAEGTKPAREQLSELALANWRREVFEMYRQVRLNPDPAAARARWREQRDVLFRAHAQSPLAADDPMRRTGVPYWPCTPRLRFSVPVIRAAESARRSLPTGGEEVTDLRQVGWVELPDRPIPGLLGVTSGGLHDAVGVPTGEAVVQWQRTEGIDDDVVEDEVPAGLASWRSWAGFCCRWRC
jgi:hypothetical protein